MELEETEGSSYPSMIHNLCIYSIIVGMIDRQKFKRDIPLLGSLSEYFQKQIFLAELLF
jgi:hypothetical protein